MSTLFFSLRFSRIHLYNRISLKKKCKSASPSDSIPIPMSHPSKNAAGVDNTFWRKFDREEYLECAREHEQKETESRSESNSKGPPIQRKPLKHRDYEVDLDSFGKDSGCYSNSTPKPTGAAYYCSVYECVVKV
ncbi:unnamed protein product [Camellia sinensis]